MPINKAKEYPKGKFFKVSNQFLRDSKLSWQAKGLLSFLLSYSENYEHSFSGIMRYSKGGRCAVQSSLKELETAGYLRRERVHVRNPDKRVLIDWIYTVSESPTDSGTFLNSPSTDFQSMENQSIDSPSIDSPSVDSPSVENRTALYNKDSSYKNESLQEEEDKLPPPLAFTEIEEKVLQWASGHQYWGQFNLLDDRVRARRFLDNQEENSLVNQFKKANQMAKTKVVNEEKAVEIANCPYCNGDGYLQFSHRIKKVSTGMTKCNHNSVKIEKFMREKGMECITRKEGVRLPPDSTNRDEGNGVPMVKNLAAQKQTGY